MKYVSEYRDADLVKGVLDEIRRTVTQPWVVMEIWGVKRTPSYATASTNFCPLKSNWYMGQAALFA